MLTRREFLVGLGILSAAAVLPVRLLKDDTKNKTKRVIAPEPMDCDWLIDNVMIIDGTSKPAFKGRVAVKGEEIVAVGGFSFPTEVKVINGEGLVLAPGFIDIHTHTEDYVYSGGDMSAFLSQGVTLQIGGNCGRSPREIASYFQTVSQLPINYGLLMGYAALREISRNIQDAGVVATCLNRRCRWLIRWFGVLAANLWDD